MAGPMTHRTVAFIFGNNLGAVGEYVPYGIVGGALLLLFRTVFRTLSVKDKEVWTLLRTMQGERDRANEWAQYHALMAGYWQARALGADPLPDFPREPKTLPPAAINIDPVPPPQ